MSQISQNCCQNVLALRNQLLPFYTQQSNISCVGAVTVCKAMKLARMMAHIAGNRLELSELVSEHLGSDAAPPAPEPAEGRGAAYNNKSF